MKILKVIAAHFIMGLYGIGIIVYGLYVLYTADGKIFVIVGSISTTIIIVWLLGWALNVLEKHYRE